MTRFQVTVDADLEPIMDRYFAIQQKELSLMDEAIVDGDAKTLSRLGHKLKGTGTSYGFPRLTELGLAIENAGKDEDLPKAQELISQARNYIENVEVVYQEIG